MHEPNSANLYKVWNWSLRELAWRCLRINCKIKIYIIWLQSMNLWIPCDPWGARICLWQTKHQQDDHDYLWLQYPIAYQTEKHYEARHITLLLDHVQKLLAIRTAFINGRHLNKKMPVSSNQGRFRQNCIASHRQRFILPHGPPCLLSMPMPPWSSFHKASTNSNQFLIARFKEFGDPHALFSKPLTVCSFCDCGLHCMVANAS